LEDDVSTPAPRNTGDEASDVDPEQFLGEFRRRMAAQGLIVRMANPQPDWEPAITLDVSGDEASAMVVRLRRGEA
jgi:hypothetical protein